MATDKCNVQINHVNREIKSHGTLDFPVGLYYDHLPFDDVPWHWHEQLEIGYVCSGKTYLSVNSEKIPIQEGEAFFINKEILHSCMCDKNDKCTIHSIVFKTELIGAADSIFAKSYINPVIENGKAPFLIFKDDEKWQRDVIKRAEAIWKNAEKEKCGYEFEIRNDLSQIMLSIFKHLPEEGQTLPGKTLRTERRMKTMLQYISENFSRELRTEDIAESASISESECVRCFHSSVGISPIRYVKQFRIQYAADLLLGSERSVSDIAAESGFMDMSYFTKSFKELKGATPSAYRKAGKRK